MKGNALFLARLLIVLASLALASCGGVKVKTEREPGTDLTSLSTYSWFPDPKLLSLYPLIRSEELDGHIRSVVDRELTTRGYRKSEDDPADFVVRYSASVSRKMGSISVREKPRYADQEDWGRWYPGGGLSSYGYDYKAGSLVIEIRRTGAETPSWRGVAEAALKEESTREERLERLDGAIRKMFKDFPSR